MLALSETFDTLNHDLLIAKVEIYGFFAKFLSYRHTIEINDYKNKYQ